MRPGPTLIAILTLALVGLLALPGLVRPQDTDPPTPNADRPTVEEVMALPDYDGPAPEALAEAIAEYADGDVGRAWSRATGLQRARMTLAEDREAAEAFLAFIERVADARLATVERLVAAEAYRLAVLVLSETREQFGRHPLADRARDRIRDLERDEAIAARLEAQGLLHEIEEALRDNNLRRAELRLERLRNVQTEGPEVARAEDLVANFEPDADRRRRAPHPFGTVTGEERIEGDLDCKGSCSRLVQGGYMKFDLRDRAPGSTIRSATLRVHIICWSGNHWRWITHIPCDPTTAPVADVFSAIQRQPAKLSGVITLRQPDGWLDVRLNRRGIDAINAALSEEDPDDRWIAMAFGFE